ncbi:MAG: sigma 54-interacting transcriptional regulator [Desulfobacterales bacterium]|nr:sigma 54-interacting transcriptional regulator [Desulfobacterales bacterium]
MKQIDPSAEAFSMMAQKVAEAIASVMGIDVTIMDNRMIRIAGTGIYKDLIGQEIEESTAFGLSQKTGQHCVVEKSRESEICFTCERLGRCREKAEVCVPIMQGRTPAGVIGVIAFNETQRQKILQNKEPYLNFIQKMADLLGAKLSEVAISQENQRLSQRLNNILNTMESALLLYGDGGDVLYKNQTLERLLDELQITDHTTFFTRLWQEIREKAPGVNENHEIHILDGKQACTLIASILLMDNNTKERIVKLEEITRFEKKIVRYTQQNQVTVTFDNIITDSDNLREAKKTAEKAAGSDSNILILGESGTGKELFARAMHNGSPRKQKTFIAINCGAIPDELLESELFGHEKGAFTGAIATKVGKFEAADGGTIFLDEISEMPYTLQVKLLRVLQEKEICRIGSNTTRKIDIRIIAATNANLIQRMQEGSFREDLYYRLNIIPLHIPPLRERPRDILFLSNFYIHLHNQRFGKHVRGLSRQAQALVTAYEWPGNVRELQNVLEYAVNFEEADEITESLLARRISPDRNRGTLSVDPPLPLPTHGALAANLEMFERQLLLQAIETRRHLKHKEIVKGICLDLKISRTTLYRRLEKHNLTLPKPSADE